MEKSVFNLGKGKEPLKVIRGGYLQLCCAPSSARRAPARWDLETL